LRASFKFFLLSLKGNLIEFLVIFGCGLPGVINVTDLTLGELILNEVFFAFEI
jgi:hypothetical protein